MEHGIDSRKGKAVPQEGNLGTKIPEPLPMAAGNYIECCVTMIDRRVTWLFRNRYRCLQVIILM